MGLRCNEKSRSYGYKFLDVKQKVSGSLVELAGIRQTNIILAVGIPTLCPGN